MCRIRNCPKSGLSTPYQPPEFAVNFCRVRSLYIFVCHVAFVCRTPWDCEAGYGGFTVPPRGQSCAASSVALIRFLRRRPHHLADNGWQMAPQPVDASNQVVDVLRQGWNVLPCSTKTFHQQNSRCLGAQKRCIHVAAVAARQREAGKMFNQERGKVLSLSIVGATPQGEQIPIELDDIVQEIACWLSVFLHLSSVRDPWPAPRERQFKVVDVGFLESEDFDPGKRAAEDPAGMGGPAARQAKADRPRRG